MYNLGFHDAFRYIYPDKEEYTFGITQVELGKKTMV